MFDPKLPPFDARLCVTYAEALRVVRGYLRSFTTAGLPVLLDCCVELGIPLQGDELQQVYFGPLVHARPDPVRHLLTLFGFSTFTVSFNVPILEGGARHLFFLPSPARFARFRKELADFDADPHYL